MKKSKFLKKSLAMLLALMLVVAMIPLSASAAQTQPALNYLYVNSRSRTKMVRLKWMRIMSPQASNSALLLTR